jgi:ABC-2 type transport system ATP-binding protein
VEQLRADGVTVVLTTHLMDEAERLADDVVVVDGGRLVAQGTLAELCGVDEALTFTAAPGLDLGPLRALLPGASTAEEVGPGRYRVVAGPAALHAVSTWAAERAIVPQGLATGRRTLEDVFLDLTGRELRP